jgi:hypothetical protein
VANYLGAHSVPKGMTADQATEDILNNQIPALKVRCLSVRMVWWVAVAVTVPWL